MRDDGCAAAERDTHRFPKGLIEVDPLGRLIEPSAARVRLEQTKAQLTSTAKDVGQSVARVTQYALSIAKTPSAANDVPVTSVASEWLAPIDVFVQFGQDPVCGSRPSVRPLDGSRPRRVLQTATLLRQRGVRSGGADHRLLGSRRYCPCWEGERLSAQERLCRARDESGICRSRKNRRSGFDGDAAHRGRSCDRGTLGVRIRQGAQHRDSARATAVL